jgi:hypothetical protein
VTLEPPPVHVIVTVWPADIKLPATSTIVEMRTPTAEMAVSGCAHEDSLSEEQEEDDEEEASTHVDVDAHQAQAGFARHPPHERALGQGFAGVQVYPSPLNPL